MSFIQWRQGGSRGRKAPREKIPLTQTSKSKLRFSSVAQSNRAARCLLRTCAAPAGASADAIERLREHRAFDLRLVRRPQSGGPASARNQGWRAARAELVAFTDDDCEPEPDWLSTLVLRLSTSGPDIAGVGGRVEPAGTGWVPRYMTYHRILEPPSSLSYLVTANCIYRRDALARVSGFNEAVKTAGGEDPGLSFALGDLGYQFAFAPDAVVRHKYRESFRDFARTFFRYGRGCRLVVDA